MINDLTCGTGPCIFFGENECTKEPPESIYVGREYEDGSPVIVGHRPPVESTTTACQWHCVNVPKEV